VRFWSPSMRSDSIKGSDIEQYGNLVRMGKFIRVKSSTLVGGECNATAARGRSSCAVNTPQASATSASLPIVPLAVRNQTGNLKPDRVDQLRS